VEVFLPDFSRFGSFRHKGSTLRLAGFGAVVLISPMLIILGPEFRIIPGKCVTCLEPAYHAISSPHSIL
jgi:hypothetical protein